MKKSYASIAVKKNHLINFIQEEIEKTEKAISPYCKPCSSAEVAVRKLRLKIQCVEYKGGKCEICGYNKCIDALEFHHLDPSQKNFLLSKIKSASLSEKIKKELDNCQLLCSNCHREKHFLEHEPKRYERKK